MLSKCILIWSLSTSRTPTSSAEGREEQHSVCLLLPWRFHYWLTCKKYCEPVSWRISDSPSCWSQDKTGVCFDWFLMRWGHQPQSITGQPLRLPFTAPHSTQCLYQSCSSWSQIYNSRQYWSQDDEGSVESSISLVQLSSCPASLCYLGSLSHSKWQKRRTEHLIWIHNKRPSLIMLCLDVNWREIWSNTQWKVERIVGTSWTVPRVWLGTESCHLMETVPW